MIRIVRRVVGLACFVLAAWWAIQGWLERPRGPLYGVDRDTGSPTGLRVSPLAGDELATALERERAELQRSWPIGS